MPEFNLYGAFVPGLLIWAALAFALLPTPSAPVGLRRLRSLHIRQRRFLAEAALRFTVRLEAAQPSENARRIGLA